MKKILSGAISKGVLLVGTSIALFFFRGPQASNNPATDSEPDLKVSDFGLIDQDGNFQNLSYYENYQAVCLFVQGNGCPIVRNAIRDLQALQQEFEPKGIKFLMINANLQDERKEIKQEAGDFNIALPILKDDHQLVADMLDLRVTAEALLIDTRSRRIKYRGPISDRLKYEAQKERPDNCYLQEAITTFLDGKEIAVPIRKTMGCAITRMSDRRPPELTYVEDIAPILKHKCVNCHQEGGIAPWAMTDYNTVVGWSSMIKDVIFTRRMPPWHADPEIGHFRNDLSLSDEEIRTLTTWLEGDLIRGEGEDPLAFYQPQVNTWTLGEPDYVMQMKSEEIPATGIIDYRYQAFEMTFDKDVYVGAVEVMPDKKEVLHHILATVIFPESYQLDLDRKRGPWIDGILAAWAPGMQPEVFPEGTGRLIPKGSKVVVQLHYTTSGRAQTDQSSIGFHFLNEKPEKEYITIGPTDFDLKILPNDPHHSSWVIEKIYEDIRIFGFFPHMHYRGKSMKYTLERPDGKRETLLSVPNYNFNWQRYYELEEPIDVPKGSRLLVHGFFDNSANNPFNPNPQDTLFFGEQTFDEMMIGYFSYHPL